MSTTTGSISVRYRVNGQEKFLDVNGTELRQKLAAFDAPFFLNSVLLGIEGDNTIYTDAWIEALMKSPARLEVTEDISCNTSFVDQFWRLRSNTDRVMCLLEHIVDYEKLKEQRNADARLVEAFRSGASLSKFENTTQLQPQIQDWQRKFEARHGIASS